MDLTSKYKTVEGKIFKLRPYKLRDSQGLFSLLTNQDVLRYFSTPKLESIEEAQSLIQDYLEGVKKGNSLRWAIADKETDEFIGMMGFRKFQWENYRGEVGYGLFPEYWGKGLIKEALGLAIQFAFSELNLHSIEAQVDPNNIASAKVLEKLGFKQEAYHKQNHYFDGQFWDTVVYSLVNSES